MRVIQIAPSLNIETGGPAYTIPSLSVALKKNDVHIDLFYVFHKNDKETGIGKDELGIHKINGISNEKLRLSWAPFLKRAVEKYCKRYRIDIVHTHGLWTLPNHSAVVAAKKNGIPLVLSPRGTMSKWAWNYKKWKKSIAMVLYQRRDLEYVGLFHATAENELEDIRRLGFHQPVAIVPNGVDIPEIKRKTQDNIERARTLLFVSRIHPKKGLPMLVEAWARLKPEGWKCIIAGPNEENHQAEIEALVKKYHMDSSFEFTGQIYGRQKEEIFRECDVFILPTHSENFGLVVAEALAYSTPAITTTGAPWKDLLDYGCGWWVNPNVDSICNAMKEAMSTPEDVIAEMGRKGRRLVIEKYSWEKAGADMKAAYFWMLNPDTPKPDFVFTE